MGHLRCTGWQKLPVNLRELCIDTTLRCGQSFRWRKSREGEWSCALHGRILSLRQDSTHLHYKSTFPSSTRSYFPMTPPSSSPASLSLRSPENRSTKIHNDDTHALIRHYFNLAPNLTELYKQWSTADPNFNKKAPKFTGVRILRQDAWEALVGFICSSNNNIIRISQMVDKLCKHYGRFLGYVGDEAYHDFPEPAALADPNVEAHLRQLGFGYRAKYLHQTAVIIATERERGWLDNLRNPESSLPGREACFAGAMVEGGRAGYRFAHEALLELQGVGPKVADCVCLMGLGWGEAVPVDTHVWQIAQRDYKFGKGKHNSLTKATYDAVGNKFRSLWGKEAGWAHSVLFTADLRAFSERLVAKVEEEETVDTNEKGKNESNAIVTQVKRQVVVDKRIRPEFEDEHRVLEVYEDMMSRVKRRRRV